MSKVRAFNKTDKLILAAALLNAGISGRIKMLNLGARLVFQGPSAPVIQVLNDEGFLFADGQPFSASALQGNQAFIRYVA